jgi:hypothetical protein
MAKYIVSRGQIEKGREVIAKQGDAYTPRNAAERDRLLAAGIITETRKGRASASDEEAEGNTGGTGENTGAGDEGGQGNT